MKTELNYPIRFEPILQEKIWGGTKLMKLLNKKSELDNIGESWEISDVENNISIVANGALKGESLKGLLVAFKDELVGENNYAVFGNKFPLLIKFIDAKEDLSVQLHPNDEIAKKRHKSFGKTEMWHIMQADNDSNLILGFNKNTTVEKYQEHLQNETLVDVLNNVPVQKGDTFFIPTGTVHAIGSGVLLAEIQQTSDITYRIYDWNRLNAKGKSRTLHQIEALDTINFDSIPEKIDYSKYDNSFNELVTCNYFTTNYIELKKSKNIDYSNRDSFTIFMCIEGNVIIYSDNFEEKLAAGETILIPNSLNRFSMTSYSAKILEIFV